MAGKDGNDDGGLGDRVVTSEHARPGYGNSRARTQAATPMAVLAAMRRGCMMGSVWAPLT